ncbi:MAG TPA: M13 family metallopeptidase [Usitatibacter sp.]|nr:M13 family metallopeptidase [Usitatibacter sp.]
MRPLLLATLLAATAYAQTPDRPITELPYTPGLDVAAMDRSADPCVDFYQYSCGGWMKNNPVPADQASWSVYAKLGQDNQRYLWGILEELAAKKQRNANEQKVGDYFAACMDEAAVENSGATPLRPWLDRIARLKTRRELPALLAELHLATGDGGLFFSFGSNQDFADSTRVIAFADSGGIGMPDRDYYVKDDQRARELRKQYVAYVARIFELLGDPADAAQSQARKVMDLETVLALATLERAERRDPYKLFHKVDRKGLDALMPQFGWSRYLAALGLGSLDTFNVTEPAFFKELQNQLHANSVEDIKSYLRYHLARSAAPYLSTDFVNANFEFFSKTLRGTKELRPRWKRCVAMVDSQLGEALGKEFVARAFPPALKERVLRMTRQVEQAMEQDIKELQWMSAETKERALAKLHTVVNKIGYPDRWRDYSSVQVKRGDFFGNVARAQRFESRRQLAKIGKPVDRGEWLMTPPTVNAYYNPQMNDVNFAAGVLQPPLFDPKMDDAPNYGNTGATIGHELTHGFDDQGRQFDAKGNLKDWWTKDDATAFNARAQCIADQYAQYVVIDDVKINSKLTLGEDVADLGGVILGWMAWKMETAGKTLEPRDGLTPEQRFFVGYAQWACENERPENQRLKAITDSHSPAKWRVNGLVVNLPEFERAFSCKAGQPMVAANRCRVW